MVIPIPARMQSPSTITGVGRATSIGGKLIMCVCLFVLPDSFRGMGAFYFKIELGRDIFNTILITVINYGSLNINITFNYLERCK